MQFSTDTHCMTTTTGIIRLRRRCSNECCLLVTVEKLLIGFHVFQVLISCYYSIFQIILFCVSVCMKFVITCYENQCESLQIGYIRILNDGLFSSMQANTKSCSFVKIKHRNEVINVQNLKKQTSTLACWKKIMS